MTSEWVYRLEWLSWFFYAKTATHDIVWQSHREQRGSVLERLDCPELFMAIALEMRCKLDEASCPAS